MFGKLNDLELEIPNDFSINDNIKGGYNTTISGFKRGYINSSKKIWTLKYNLLSVENYSLLYAELNKEISNGVQELEVTSTFKIYEPRLKVISENVHIELSDRGFSNNMLIDVTLTLLQI